MDDLPSFLKRVPKNLVEGIDARGLNNAYKILVQRQQKTDPVINQLERIFQQPSVPVFEIPQSGSVSEIVMTLQNFFQENGRNLIGNTTNLNEKQVERVEKVAHLKCEKVFYLELLKVGKYLLSEIAKIKSYLEVLDNEKVNNYRPLS